MACPWPLGSPGPGTSVVKFARSVARGFGAAVAGRASTTAAASIVRTTVGATLREEDFGQGRLPRSCALYPRKLREEQRAAVGRCPLGFSGMGLALPLGPGSFRALCRCAG